MRILCLTIRHHPISPWISGIRSAFPTLTISTAASLNQCVSRSYKPYQALKESNKKNSFAEWYGIYPVQPHFADYLPGSYMNGGVTTIVAGELAKLHFSTGYENCGVDILQRLMELIKKYNGDLPASYTNRMAR